MNGSNNVNEKVTVISIYDCERGSVMPVKLKWRGHIYRINKLGFHHKVRQGRTLLHVFSVANESMFFKLILDTDTLSWSLQETYDTAGT